MVMFASTLSTSLITTLVACKVRFCTKLGDEPASCLATNVTKYVLVLLYTFVLTAVIFVKGPATFVQRVLKTSTNPLSRGQVGASRLLTVRVLLVTPRL